MLKIRFFRVGKKHQPLFKIVVTDKRKPPKGGRFVEEVGFWNPLKKKKVLKKERIEYWLSKGAKPSDSVYNLLVREKILEGAKIPVHKKKKKKKEKVETKEKVSPSPLAKGEGLKSEPEKEIKKSEEKKEQSSEEKKKEKQEPKEDKTQKTKEES